MKHKLGTGSKTEVALSPITAGILYLCGAAAVVTVKGIIHYGKKLKTNLQKL